MSVSKESSTQDAEMREMDFSLAFLRLRVWGRETRMSLPLLKPSQELVLGREPYSLELRDGQVFLCPRGEKGGAPRKLLLGERIGLEELELSLVDLRECHPFSLLALDPELAGRCWEFPCGETTIGRGASRQNVVLLNFPTVSREHATLFAARGESSLRKDGRALTAINGRELRERERAELRNGDIVQLGDQLFRFAVEEQSFPTGERELEFCLLDEVSVRCDRLGTQNLRVSSRKAFELLLWLLCASGHRLGVRQVLAHFWPERSHLRQRKNLSQALKSLEHDLGFPKGGLERLIFKDEEFLTLRTSQVRSCDLWCYLQKDVLEGGYLSGPPTLLPGFDFPPWLESVRAEVLLHWLRRTKHLLGEREVGRDWEETLRESLEPFRHSRAARIRINFELGNLGLGAFLIESP